MPRADFPIPEFEAVESLAAALAKHHDRRNNGAAMMDTRKWAGTLVDELRKRGIGFTRHPKVVAIGAGEARPYSPRTPTSTKELRASIAQVWQDQMHRADNPIDAFSACIRATLHIERGWSLEDAVLHTIRFIVPEEYRRPPPPRY